MLILDVFMHPIMIYLYVMLLVQIDKKQNRPVYQQIVDQIIERIISGAMKEGEKLPSSRKFADMLGLNRTTVYRAYQELWAAGYIESDIGGYSRVRIPKNFQNKINGDSTNVFNWEVHFSKAIQNLPQKSIGDYRKSDTDIDFRSLSPDPSLLPYDSFRKCVNEVLRQNSKDVLDYGEPQGYLPLRNEVAKKMIEHGVMTSSEEVLLTNGIQNGLELLIKVLINPGDTIFVENPTYARALDLFRILKVNVIGINLGESGIDLEQLESLLKSHKPKLVYTIPTFHNPTGVATSQMHREKLLALCQIYQTPIIEDGFEEDMKYFGKAVMPIKSMDRSNLVVYQGTFSKVLFPGLRVGWIIADKRLISKLVEVKRVCELSSVTLAQAALYQFCADGKFELHKQRMHRAYKKRMQVALQSCRKYMPEGKVEYTKPDGGYLIWFRLVKTQIDEDEFVEEVRRKGVLISPGSFCFTEKNEEVYFRLSISNSSEEEISEGIKRIAEVVEQV